MAPISAVALKTAVLLVDIQSAFRVPEFFGGQRNNDRAEDNIQILLDATRSWNEEQALATQGTNSPWTNAVEIIHIHHHSTNPNSPLHPSFILPAADAMTQDASKSRPIRGTDPLPCAQVIEGEVAFTKSVNSAFIGTPLERYLREKRIRQLIVCGLTTDHCVSTTVRMAANMKVVDGQGTGEQGKILVVEDACAAFGKGEFPADLVHRVHIESLRDEFAEVTTVEDVLKHVLQR